MSVFPVLSPRDYDATIKFYTEKLGFNVDMSMQMPDGNMFGILTLNGRETMLGFGDNEKANDFVRAQGVMFMLYPDNFDIDAYYEQVKQRGVKIDTEIKTEAWGDRTFAIKDPDGHHIVFAKTVETVSAEEASKRLHEEAAAK